MKGNPAISLIGGLIITTVIITLLFFLYIILTFYLAGGESLQEIENQRTILLLLSMLGCGLTVLECRRFIKIGKKYAAIGIGILPFGVLILVSVYYFANYNYHTNFDKKTWQQEKCKPFDMAVTLVKDNELIGITRDQLIELLG